ncbi:MAG TPA: rod shape-determining protein MreC [Candidatus Angelobacter sp.]|nr:rod shape-determining protein MreC [Candidatus Angelobacter sp.]
MENFFARYKNPLVLMAVLFIQVVALATQVKRQEDGKGAGGGTRLIRVWTVTAFTPVEKMFVSTGRFFRDSWHNYVDLRNVRKQNRELQDQISRLQMEQARDKQDADQAKRLQVLLDFKEKFVAKTVAAQVIATSGTEQSRVMTIDKGSNYHIKPDMAVITPDGIVGKVKEVFPLSSQVLLINDRDSGAGVILESTRLQGIVKGTSTGELQVTDVMSDEKVEAGEHVITSGGDRIFPKGLSVGTVISASPDRDNDPFLNIRIKPAADLSRLEEVLIVTIMTEAAPSTGTTSLRAADILSERLPSIPKQDPNAPKTPGAAATATPGAGSNQPGSSRPKTPAGTTPDQKKEGSGATAAVKTPPTGNATTNPSAPAAKPLAGPSANGTTSDAKPAGATAAPGANGTMPSSPATTARQPVNAGQPVSGGTNTSTASATPTPKPKATPAKPKVPAGTAGSSGTPDSNRQPAKLPAPTPTATPENPPR